jgi:hypothetical protein
MPPHFFIDRILPDFGYAKDNIIISCYRCNSIKRDANYDELINIGEVLKILVENKINEKFLAIETSQAKLVGGN